MGRVVWAWEAFFGMVVGMVHRVLSVAGGVDVCGRREDVIFL